MNNVPLQRVSNSSIQSVLFDKNTLNKDRRKLWTKGKAKRWLINHNLQPLKFKETKNFYTFRIKNPSVFKAIRFKTFSVEKGIKARIGFTMIKNSKTNKIIKNKESYIRTSMNGKKTRVKKHKQSYHQRNSAIGRQIGKVRRKGQWWIRDNNPFTRSRFKINPDLALILYASSFPTTPQKIINYYVPANPEIEKRIKTRSYEAHFREMQRLELIKAHNMIVVNPRLNKYIPAKEISTRRGIKRAYQMLIVQPGNSIEHVYLRFDPPITRFEFGQIDNKKMITQSSPRNIQPSAPLQTFIHTETGIEIRKDSQGFWIVPAGFPVEFLDSDGEFPDGTVVPTSTSNITVPTVPISELNDEGKNEILPFQNYVGIPELPDFYNGIDVLGYHSIVSYDDNRNNELPKPSQKRNTVFFLTERGMVKQNEIKSLTAREPEFKWLFGIIPTPFTRP